MRWILLPVLALLAAPPAAAQGLRFRPEEAPPVPPAEAAPPQPQRPPRPRPRPRAEPAEPREEPRSEAPALSAGQPGVLLDPRTRCAVWVSDPHPDETVRWSGRCRNGAAQGQGDLLRQVGDRVTSLVSGHFEGGRLNGPAVVTLGQGWRVEAEFTAGLAPFGVVRRGADIYQGQLRDALPHGRGIWVFANGARYEGEWLRGERSGRGRLIDQRGEYDGMWLNDRRNGPGIQREGDVSVYRGEWRDDRRHGLGIETYANGIVIQGSFVNDRPEGRIVYTAPDQQRYAGEMVDGCLRTRWRSYRIIGTGECR